MKINYLSIQDFTKIDNCSYSKNKGPKCKLENYRSGHRISYRLPNGIKEWHYPGKAYTTTKLSVYLTQFEGALKSGYFPKSVVKKLYNVQGESLPGETTIEQAVDDYYGVYNAGKRQKNPRTTAEERPALEYLLREFKSRYGLKYVSDFTTTIVTKINKDLDSFLCKKTGKRISIATIKTYKKLLKSFLNCLGGVLFGSIKNL